MLERAKAPPRGLVAVFVASTSLLLLTRGLSPLWAALIAATLALLGGRRVVVQLVRDRSLRFPMAIIGAAAVLAIVWIVAAHANDLVPTNYKVPSANESTWSLLVNIMGQTGTWVQQMLGAFGWIDSPSPLVTFLIWYAAIGFVVLFAVAAAPARGVVTMTFLIVVVAFVPVVIVYHEAHHLGIDWAGRYTLPLAVGIPILGTALMDGADALTRVRSRVAAILCIGIGVGQFSGFFTALRRYAGGLPGPMLPENGTWAPPLGNGLMMLWALVATALLVGAIAVVVCHARSDDEAALQLHDGQVRGAPAV
jgi:hypothetical protein